MQNWLLQNLSDVLNRELELQLGIAQTDSRSDFEQIGEKKYQKYYSYKHHLAELNAQREWRGAIASVEELLLSEIGDSHNKSQKPISASTLGLVFSAPVPLLSNCELLSRFQSAIFTPDAFKVNALMPCRYSAEDEDLVNQDTAPVIELPLIPQDPIAQEQFCLILTANFGLILVLGKDTEGNPKFHFSFDPLTLGKVWTTLRSRLVIAKYHRLTELDRLIEQFTPPTPNYQLVTNFSRRLLHHIPDLEYLSAN
ncbi:MAG: hypothetical protein RLZZ69_3113, partial [Cyanobacteriota bacterium]